MANRTFSGFEQTMEKDVVSLYARVNIGAAGAPTLVVENSKGICAVDLNVIDFGGTVTSGSPTITGVTSFTGIYIGMTITGFGIPDGTTIIAFNIGAGTITMSQNATGSAAPVSPAPLGTLANFAVLAGSTITNTGGTVITGDIGLSPGSAVTGFPPGSVSGTIHISDADAIQAKVDLVALYVNLDGRVGAIDKTGIDLGTLTLGPGVYNYDTSAQLTGTLILDGGGDPDAAWVFQIGSTLTTASSSVVSLVNSASAANVFWQVGSSATIGTSTTFKGTIVALTSITATTSATVDGRLLARNGAVTLDTNTITVVTAPDSSTSVGSNLSAFGGQYVIQFGLLATKKLDKYFKLLWLGNCWNESSNSGTTPTAKNIFLIGNNVAVETTPPVGNSRFTDCTVTVQFGTGNGASFIASSPANGEIINFEFVMNNMGNSTY